MSEDRVVVGVTRRQALRWSALTGGLILGSGVLQACASDGGSGAASGSEPPPSGARETGSTAASTPASTIGPVRGGVLRVGAIGGGAGDTLDPHVVISALDVIRTLVFHESLAEYTPERTIELTLAESITPSDDGMSWTIRLKKGLVFHDGRPITADDVIFSLRRIIDPESPKNGAPGLGSLRMDGMTKVDELTVELALSRPDFMLLESFSAYSNAIVPVDFDPAAAVGAGGFKLGSFTPGERSSFARHDGWYRRDDGPYLDEIDIINFANDTAVVNALVSGELEVVLGLPASQLRTLEGNDNLVSFSRPSGNWYPFTMNVEMAPFDDERVRQAFRLIVDREQMIEQVYGGKAVVANDLWSPFDENYAGDLPQRVRDIDAAKALLEEAGVAGLEIDLVTCAMGTGITEAAQVFAQQAKDAGVTVNVRVEEPSVFFTESYGQVAFSQDIWDERPLFAQTFIALAPGGTFNPTRWDDPRTNELIELIRAEPDEETRSALLREVQQIQYERGGYIVWSFQNSNDAVTASVQGADVDGLAQPLHDLWIG
jgi:peptide/nickel transport system substrate-binding protein